MNEKFISSGSNGFSIVSVAPVKPNQIDPGTVSHIKALQAAEMMNLSGISLDGIVKAGKSLHGRLIFSSYIQRYNEKSRFALDRLQTDIDLRPPLVKFSSVKDPKSKLEDFLTYRMFQSDVKLVRSILENSGFSNTEGHDWNLLWIGHNPKPNFYEKIGIYQKISHFPNSFEITRKDRLCSSIMRMQDLHGKENYNFTPDTYNLPEDFSLLYSNFTRDKKSVWIVKPTCSSQGKGIYLIDSISEVPVDETCIISRYVSNPLLINCLKFDLRIYVLVSSYEPLRVYIYQEGLARFASEAYKNGCKSNRFMHLTNYSLNKKSENFVQNEDFRMDDMGHKWSLSAVMKLLESQGINTDLLWKNIYELIIKTIISCEHSVIETCHRLGLHRNNCFDLLGFDVLIDSNLKPWLLEVNLSPSLATDSPLDAYIKSNLLADMFNLIGLRKFDKKKDTYSRTRPFSKTSGKKPTRSQSPAKIEVSGKLKDILRETLEEQERANHFIRIYPCKGSNFFDQFFLTPRLLNQHLYKSLYIDIMQDPEGLNSFKLRPMTCGLDSDLCPPISPQKPQAKRPVSIETPKRSLPELIPEDSKYRCKNCKDHESFCSYCKLLKTSKEEKIIITSDDVLIEYLSRLASVLKNSKENLLKPKWKKKMNSFILHPAWIYPDQELKLWKRLVNRQQEMKDRRKKLFSALKRKKIVCEDPDKEEVVACVLRKFLPVELEEILMASTRNTAHDLVRCLVQEDAGVLSEMLTGFRTEDAAIDTPSFEETEYRTFNIQARSKKGAIRRRIIV
jgi:tubulin polyglutamylase TTLL5